MLRNRSDHGLIEGVGRQNSTLQKDWCFAHSHELPDQFCIAVVGHPGWDQSPNTTAKYSLVVTLEAVDEDMLVYQEIRAAVEAEVDIEQRIGIPSASDAQ